MCLLGRSCMSHDECLSKVAYRRNGAGQILVSRQKNGARPERPSAANRLMAMEEKEIVIWNQARSKHDARRRAVHGLFDQDAALLQCLSGKPNPRQAEVLRMSRHQMTRVRCLYTGSH